MSISRIALSLFGSAALVAGCTMSSGDRCPSGYHWDPDNTVCKKCDEDEVWDTEGYECLPDSDTGTGTGGGTDTDTESDSGGVSGMGESCSSDDDCSDYDADYCAINPMTQEGYCTIDDCAPGGCPAGYQCCDCSESTLLPQISACISEDEVDLVEGMGGCTCE